MHPSLLQVFCNKEENAIQFYKSGQSPKKLPLALVQAKLCFVSPSSSKIIYRLFRIVTLRIQKYLFTFTGLLKQVNTKKKYKFQAISKKVNCIPEWEIPF